GLRRGLRHRQVAVGADHLADGVLLWGVLRVVRIHRLGHRCASPALTVRCRISVPMTLISSVMPSNTRPAYIRAPFSTGPDSGHWLAISAARVLPGANSDQLKALLLPRSIARAIVSPTARPKARMIDP